MKRPPFGGGAWGVRINPQLSLETQFEFGSEWHDSHSFNNIVTVNLTVFCDVTPYSLVDIYLLYG